MKTKTSRLLLLSAFLIAPLFVAAAPGEELKLFKENAREKAEVPKVKVKEALKNNQEKVREKQQGRAEKLEEQKAKRLAFACENISEKLAGRQTQFNEQKELLRVKKAERGETRQEDRAKRDQELAAKRKASEERRAKMYQNLLNKAETDEQKEAVQNFRTAVEAAITARRQAVDEAITSFRKSVDTLHATKKDTRVEALSAFQAEASSALQKAKEDCANGVDSSTVRETYKSTLDQARATLKENRKDESMTEQMKVLVETKNASLRQAASDYQAALEAALTALKAALGEAGTSSTPEAS